MYDLIGRQSGCMLMPCSRLVNVVLEADVSMNVAHLSRIERCGKQAK